MSFICDNCEKSIVYGRSQRHGRGVAGKRWNKRAHMTSKIFLPNIQKIAILEKGKKVSMDLCAKCIKRFKKEGKLKFYSAASV